MKKFIAIVMALLCCCSLAGCQSNQDTAETPNACVPSVMYEGNIYCTTGKQMPVKVDESAILGTVTSTVPLSQWPTEDGQANFEALDAPYALISEGFVVLVENEWTLFEMRAVDASEGAVEENVQETPEAEEESESVAAPQPEGTFSFAELSNRQFAFLSGAGGWATYMTIQEDGSFTGEYFDGNMGVTGEGYPKGTMYRCDFTGQFTTPVKVNDYTYSMQIQEISYAKEPGIEEIIDGVLYCYVTPYGLDEAEDILIYLPGAPLSELSEEFRSWVGYYDLSITEETELPFYALNNESQQYGFSSYSFADRSKEIVAFAEEQAAVLEDYIANDALTQTDLNIKTQELYEVWDYALNELWAVLKKALSAEEMETLLIEQREWVTQKEQAVKEAGAEYEGGSIQSMVMNNKATELTKERIYELLELLK